jgi:protein TonB
MRKGVVISLAFHALAVLLTLQAVSFRQVTYIPRETYRVRLVSPANAQAITPVTATKPEPPAPQEEPKPEPPKEEELAAPIPSKKPKPPEGKKAKEVPRAEIAKGADSTSAAADTASAATGAPDGVRFDGGDFPFDAFIGRMRHKIAAAWQVPAGSEGIERSTVVYFRVHRNGSVTHTAVEQSSGVLLFDQSCQRAVLQAAPFPPLPREYPDEYVGVHFTFKYAPTQ